MDLAKPQPNLSREVVGWHSPSHELLKEEATASLQDSSDSLLASQKDFWAQTGII